MNTPLSTLSTAGVHVPQYDRSRLKPRIVHIGFGAFARAHQAFVLDALHRQGVGEDWGCWAVYINRDNRETIDELAAHDFCYSVMCKDHLSQQTTVCGALLGASNRHSDGIDAVVARLASPDTDIITLTITEKGYCCTPDGNLDRENPAIIYDLAHPNDPQSAIGVIVAALKQRRQLGLDGLTVLSCDNIPSNGARSCRVICEFAALFDEPSNNTDAQKTETLTDWIRTHVAFPDCMVDRIVPATTEQSLTMLADALGGIRDNQGIVCEPFLQWVIADNFHAEHPVWQHFPGVRLVDDVAHYETLKLRLLNGAHSFLAYLGYLGGYETIADTMNDPHYRTAAKALMLNEQANTLPPIADFDINDYAETLIRRFENPALQHRTWQIAADGSQKLPQRLLRSAEHRLNNGQSIDHIALGIAAWMVYVGGVDEQGQAIDVRDPYAATFAELTASANSDSETVERLLAMEAVFTPKLVAMAAFQKAIHAAYYQLKQQGARRSVAKLANNNNHTTSEK